MTQTDLKRKTINGFFWSLLENVFSQGLNILFSIILIKILPIKEFGLLGEISIAISIAQVFIDSGLSQALIRKQNCTNIDLSTVFWVNMVIGIFTYSLIWVFAPIFALFFKEPQLILLLRVSALSLIIGSLTIIQQTILIKEFNFRVNTKITTLGSVISGSVSIIMALLGFGIWSLIWKNIVNQAVVSILLWSHNHWKPLKLFNFPSFKELFGFGSNILIISIIATIFRNIYNAIIGKCYSLILLGHYTNANTYSSLPSNIFLNMTNKVSYPILSTMQNDNIKLRDSCRKLIQTMMYISFFVMFGLAAMAKSLLIVVIGIKMLPSVVFFQILCLAYSILPMHVINQNILKIKGHSNLFLKTELIKYLVFIPFILAGILYGLEVLIIGIVLFYWISFFVNAMYSNKLISYSVLNQMVDFIPVMLITLIPAIIVYVLSYVYQSHMYFLLAWQIIVYVGIVCGLSILFKIEAFYEIKNILINKLTILNLVKTIKK